MIAPRKKKKRTVKTPSKKEIVRAVMSLVPVPQQLAPHVCTIGLPMTAQTLRQLIQAVPEHGDILVADGEWNLTISTIITPKLAIVNGCDRERCTLVSTNYTVSAAQCVFELNNNIYCGLTLESRVGQGQQSQTIGHQGYASASNSSSYIYDCRVVGHSFAVYIWGGMFNKIFLYDTIVLAGKWGVCAGVGSGPDGCYIELYNCNIVIDYARYPGAGGDQGDTIGGLIARGGAIKMYGGSITTIGAPTVNGTPLDVAACAWTTPQPGPPSGYPQNANWPMIELFGVALQTIPNGAKKSADLIATVGIIKAHKCTGSGTYGAPTVIQEIGARVEID